MMNSPLSPLSGKFHFKEVIGFAWTTILMVMFMSMYTMVDGVFVSRILGTTALSAVNICVPFISCYWAAGTMLATGSVAIVARQLGEGDVSAARRNLSFMFIVAALAGALFAVGCYLVLDPLLRFLGATPEIHHLCRSYSIPLLPFIPAAVLQMMVQTYFLAAGRPGLGFFVVLLGGGANIILDYLFMAVMGWGLEGAAVATGIGCCIPALLGVLYFACNRTGSLRFAKPAFDGRTLLSSLVNGSSEMVSSVSAAIVVYLFNIAMLKRLGVDGVAAITIVLYAEYLLNSVYFGFASGVSPLFSYQFGREDTGRLRKLFRNSLIFICIVAVLSIAVAWSLAGSIVSLFAPGDNSVFDIAFHGMRLFSAGFALMGFNVFFSALFTALSNGKISALLAASRSALIIVCIVLFPHVIGINGIWLAVPAAELITLGISAVCVIRYKPVYRYY